MKSIRVTQLAVLIASMIARAALAEERSAPILPKDTLPESVDIGKTPAGIALARNIPADNQLTQEKVALGRMLFFDPILSKDLAVSCASCHQPEHGFASPDKTAIGIGGQAGERNSPSLLNRAFGHHFFWDGRAASLAEQALKPIENSKELGENLPDVLAKLKADEVYQAKFKEAFPLSSSSANDDGSRDKNTANTDAITAANLAMALASFQRTLLIGNSPVDHFQAGEYSALNAQQRKGLWIFESRGACWKCHSGDNYTDERFHNTGIGYGRKERDLGRFRVTRVDGDKGRFKTPTLRGAARTAPYMHDGSLRTLRDVVLFYNRGGEPKDPNLDHRIKPLGLTNDEVDALVALLEALSEE